MLTNRQLLLKINFSYKTKAFNLPTPFYPLAPAPPLAVSLGSYVGIYLIKDYSALQGCRSAIPLRSPCWTRRVKL